ncbi:MAG: hypothetical protein JNL60_00855 [Bacteroidia bacterium]|nr:hypothetical protein [Bacteroidia bacterium]
MKTDFPGPEKNDPPVKPEKHIPTKPDQDPDPTKHPSHNPEKADPTRIKEPPKTDPTRIDNPPPVKPDNDQHIMTPFQIAVKAGIIPLG